MCLKNGILTYPEIMWPLYEISHLLIPVHFIQAPQLIKPLNHCVKFKKL